MFLISLGRVSDFVSICQVSLSYVDISYCNNLLQHAVLTSESAHSKSKEDKISPLHTMQLLNIFEQLEMTIASVLNRRNRRSRCHNIRLELCCILYVPNVNQQLR